MERKRKRRTRTKCPSRLPDAICLSPSTGFTQIKNSLLRDPSLSFKAKGLLCFLLSNESGKWTSYLETIQRYAKEGETAIRNALKELEKARYLMKVHYADKKTKRRKGTFWAYTDTPGEFRIEKHLEFLERHGLEVQGMEEFLGKECIGKEQNEQNPRKNPHVENPHVENPHVENPHVENHGLKILNYKNTNLEKEKSTYTRNCERIYKHWMEIASHIHKPKYIDNLEKIVVERLKETKWKLGDVLQAISNYVEVYNDDSYYYSHKFTFQTFIKQRNGVPRFQPGMDVQFDGDIWRDYCARKEKKEASSTQPKPSADPKEIIQRHFNGSEDMTHLFMRNCYFPAKSLLPNTDGGELAEALLQLYSQIVEFRNKYFTDQMRSLLPGVLDVIADYIEWLRDGWVDTPRLSMFDVHSKVFAEFRRDEAKKDNLERDCLTGKSYMRG